MLDNAIHVYTPTLGELPADVSDVIPIVPTAQFNSTPYGSAMAEPVPMAPADSYYVDLVEPTYVLYTRETMDDILIPRNGCVKPENFDVIVKRFGTTLPKYILAATEAVQSTHRRPLPVLATLETSPTVWYGRAAMDMCRMLCVLYGGALGH